MANVSESESMFNLFSWIVQFDMNVYLQNLKFHQQPQLILSMIYFALHLCQVASVWVLPVTSPCKFNVEIGISLTGMDHTDVKLLI